jgi:hypothetical protein
MGDFVFAYPSSQVCNMIGSNAPTFAIPEYGNAANKLL